MKQSKIENKTEIQTIREELGMSRFEFCRVVLKDEIQAQTLAKYEIRERETRNSLLVIARKWKEFKDAQ